MVTYVRFFSFVSSFPSVITSKIPEMTYLQISPRMDKGLFLSEISKSKTFKAYFARRTRDTAFFVTFGMRATERAGFVARRT